MENEKVMVLQLPPGHGHLKIAKREKDYLFLICYSETYHEPQSTIPKDEASTPVLGIAFSDVRTVDAYISALSKLSAKMKEEQK